MANPEKYVQDLVDGHFRALSDGQVRSRATRHGGRGPFALTPTRDYNITHDANVSRGTYTEATGELMNLWKKHTQNRSSESTGQNGSDN